MDGAVHTAASEKRRIGRVDDGINADRGDVGNDDVQRRRANQSLG